MAVLIAFCPFRGSEVHAEKVSLVLPASSIHLEVEGSGAISLYPCKLGPGAHQGVLGILLSDARTWSRVGGPHLLPSLV